MAKFDQFVPFTAEFRRVFLVLVQIVEAATWPNGFERGVGIVQSWRIGGKEPVMSFFRDFSNLSGFQCSSVFRKGAKYSLFGADWFLQAAHTCRMVREKTKRVSTKKTSKISRILSRTALDTVKGMCNHNDLYLWHRGSIPGNDVQVKHRPKPSSLQRKSPPRYGILACSWWCLGSTL